MTQTVCARVRGLLPFFFPLVAATLLAGCVSYSPSQLSAMSGVDLCELREVQGVNLSDETKRALQSELQRRNDNCGNHATVLAERRQAFLHRETYGKHDDP